MARKIYYSNIEISLILHSKNMTVTTTLMKPFRKCTQVCNEIFMSIVRVSS